MTASETNSAGIKKLTKRKKETGELYARRPEAELQIGKVLSMDSDKILQFLKIRERNADDYLFDETIVYFLRNSQGSENFRIDLYRELNRRIWGLLKKFYKRFKTHTDFEDFGQKIELAVIKKVFDKSSDSADYAEVNFGDFVITAAKVAWRGELVSIEREKELFYTEREGSDPEENGSQIENTLKSKDALTDYTMMLKEGLKLLPSHIMTVAELLLDGWQIESKDEQEPTISKKLGVSSRTIRNWLKEARVILAEYQAEVRK